MSLNRLSREERWRLVFRLIAGQPRDWTDEDDQGPYDRTTADYYNRMDDDTAPREALNDETL